MTRPPNRTDPPPADIDAPTHLTRWRIGALSLAALLLAFSVQGSTDPGRPDRAQPLRIRAPRDLDHGEADRTGGHGGAVTDALRRVAWELARTRLPRVPEPYGDAGGPGVEPARADRNAVGGRNEREVFDPHGPGASEEDPTENALRQVREAMRSALLLDPWGNEIAISDLVGRVVVLAFPMGSARDAARFSEIARACGERYGERHFLWLTVHSGIAPEQVASFLESKGLTQELHAFETRGAELGLERSVHDLLTLRAPGVHLMDAEGNWRGAISNPRQLEAILDPWVEAADTGSTPEEWAEEVSPQGNPGMDPWIEAGGDER